MCVMTGEGGTTPRTTTPVVVVPAPHDPIGAQQEDLMMISTPTSSSTLRLALLNYSCLLLNKPAMSMTRLVVILIQLRRNPLAPHVSSLLLRRCLQQLAPSQRLKQMPQGDLFSAYPHSIRWQLRR